LRQLAGQSAKFLFPTDDEEAEALGGEGGDDEEAETKLAGGHDDDLDFEPELYAPPVTPRSSDTHLVNTLTQAYKRNDNPDLDDAETVPGYTSDDPYMDEDEKVNEADVGQPVSAAELHTIDELLQSDDEEDKEESHAPSPASSAAEPRALMAALDDAEDDLADFVVNEEDIIGKGKAASSGNKMSKTAEALQRASEAAASIAQAPSPSSAHSVISDADSTMHAEQSVGHTPQDKATVNSSTMKTAYAQFMRRVKSREFPTSLVQMTKTGQQKMSLFSMWLDHGKDMNAVQLRVERNIEFKKETTEGWKYMKVRYQTKT
jgi:hypothetical protein